VIFLVSTWAQSNGASGGAPWIGYCPGGRGGRHVGALADWFAVTALFKHPLGNPDPAHRDHQAQEGPARRGPWHVRRETSWSPEVVEAKLRGAEVAGRMGKWLSEPSHAERVAAEASTVLRVLVEMLRDEDIPAGSGPDDRQAHRRTTVGAADRTGAGQPAGGGAPGGAHSAVGGSRVRVVPELGRGHREGDRT